MRARASLPHGDAMRTISTSRGPSTLTIITATLVSATLAVASAISFGVDLPGSWLSEGPRDATALDYRALDARLERMRDGYVHTVLGGPAGASGASRAGGSDVAATTGPRRRVAVVHDFTNDDFGAAYTVSGVPFTARTTNAAATREPTEPSGCLPAGGTSWYRYSPAAAGGFLADTFGTDGPAGLAVYRGSDLAHLESLGCDASALGNAQVGASFDPGTTYWFQLMTPVGATTVFELTPIGATTIETVAPDGSAADGNADHHPAISADGRYVAFVSYAHNLVHGWPGCKENDQARQYCSGLYLRDVVMGTTTLIAVHGQPYAEGSLLLPPSITADGRYVAFAGYRAPVTNFGNYIGAPTEAPGMAFSSYIYDRLTGRTELASRTTSGEPAGRGSPSTTNQAIANGSMFPSLSSNGRYLVFGSDADNLRASGDSNIQVYRRDLQTGEVRLVSTDADGRPLRGNACTYSGRNVSDDGRHVLFMDTAGTGTENEVVIPFAPAQKLLYHVYLWDEASGATTQLTKLPPGVQTRGSYCPALSADGSHAAFVTRDALVADDTNDLPDVYVYDVSAKKLTRVSVTSDGRQTYDPNYTDQDAARSVTLSADGRYAVFDSVAPDLVPITVGGSRRAWRVPGPRRIYLHDLVTRATTLVSVTSTGEPLAGDSRMPYISSDGSTVTFYNKDATGVVNVVVHRLR